MSHGLLNHLDALENISRYPPLELKPVGRGQPASLSPSQEEHLSNQPASPLLSQLIKITNQHRKLHCGAADGANFKTDHRAHRAAVRPEGPAPVRGMLSLTGQTREGAYIPSKTHNEAILLMQLFQNSDAADYPLESFSDHKSDARIVANFRFGHNRLPLEARPKLAATGRFRSDLRR